MAKRERVNCEKCGSFIHTTKQHATDEKRLDQTRRILRMISELSNAGYDIDLSCHIGDHKHKFIEINGNKTGEKKT